MTGWARWEGRTETQQMKDRNKHSRQLRLLIAVFKRRGWFILENDMVIDILAFNPLTKERLFVDLMTGNFAGSDDYKKYMAWQAVTGIPVFLYFSKVDWTDGSEDGLKKGL